MTRYDRTVLALLLLVLLLAGGGAILVAHQRATRRAHKHLPDICAIMRRAGAVCIEVR